MTIIINVSNVKMKPFKPNSKFKRKCDRVFRNNPKVADLFLLLAELASRKKKTLTLEGTLAGLMAARIKKQNQQAREVI